jgi:hypothetical protein
MEETAARFMCMELGRTKYEMAPNSAVMIPLFQFKKIGTALHQLMAVEL